MGSLLVTCKPNRTGGTYTVTHGGEQIADDVPLERLHMNFSQETIRADSIIQTFEIVVDYDASYLLEELTNKVSIHKTAIGTNKESLVFPLPDGPVSKDKEHRLTDCHLLADSDLRPDTG
jgi:hypothetical protein